MNPLLSLKPYILEAKNAHKNGLVKYIEKGTAIVSYNGVEIIVPHEKQFDLTQATIFGLNERITANSTSPLLENGKNLRDLFNEEWELYSEALARAEGPDFDYGYYAFYPEKGDLVRFCSPFWHHVVSVASSSKLLTDKEQKMSWKQIRDCFENTTIAVAGCSVGSSVIHSSVLDMRPRAIKIADKSVYKMENINRVRLSYSDIVKTQARRENLFDLALKNKAHVIASQLYSIDPFMDVYIYDEGVNPACIQSFLGGIEGGVPKTDIVVEEVDDPRIKIMIREEARKRGLPVIMVTDIGSAVQLDVMRYDKKSDEPLGYGISDNELRDRMERVYERAGDRKVFFEFVDALIGTDYRRGELNQIIEEKSEIPTATIIPQLGSTVAMAGAIAAEAIARIRLGYDYPPRVVIDKQTFETRIYR